MQVCHKCGGDRKFWSDVKKGKVLYVELYVNFMCVMILIFYVKKKEKKKKIGKTKWKEKIEKERKGRKKQKKKEKKKLYCGQCWSEDVYEVVLEMRRCYFGTNVFGWVEIFCWVPNFVSSNSLMLKI
jgi:hypothetical protein